MCKSNSKMFSNFKIGQEKTEKLNFENELAQAEIENEHSVHRNQFL